ncbi:gluconokinase [Paenibacillus spongiae]|uniref:Gluconokinase n=1 Tax=Paenibacillus spongiae TaxID=2909671 RepID=A0ABY5S5Q5_9BACL|nr:gluconokinase [Paenibacillus spongiae]UVI27885.1 gluconokinase [Paenibacillus spongiae]
MSGNSNSGGRKIIIAVDIGTTSVKVLAADAGILKGSGDMTAVIAKAAVEYPLNEPYPGRFEQDPDRIADAVESSVRALLKQDAVSVDEIIGVSFSSAMHSLMAVDADGVPLTALITWADLRAASYAGALRSGGQAAEIARRTGVPVHAMTPLCKLMWLRDHEPVTFQAAHAFIGVKEYVLYRWFGGSYIMDESVAGGTGLYNLLEGDWDSEALALAGIDAGRLPRLAASTHVLKGMRQETADALGLPADIPVVVGAADGVLANLGAGAVEEGVAAVTVGTSGAVRIGLDRPAADEKGRLFCYKLADGLWFSGGPVNSGGVVLRWLRDKLVPADAQDAAGSGVDPYERIVALAMETKPGADGLLCLAHLAGERAPHWDEDARGVFFGLSLGHDRRHLLRAGLEGIVLGLRAVAEAVAATAGGPLREIRASGGFARSAALRQLMADIFGCPVTLADTEEASAIGAAMLALLALGEAGSLRGLASAVQTADRREPQREAADVYDRLYPVYRSLYDALAPAFADIAAYQRGLVRSDA